MGRRAGCLVDEATGAKRKRQTSQSRAPFSETPMMLYWFFLPNGVLAERLSIINNYFPSAHEAEGASGSHSTTRLAFARLRRASIPALNAERKSLKIVRRFCSANFSQAQRLICGK